MGHSEFMKNIFSEFNKTEVKSRCLKIIGKVSFNIECVASYVYILSGQRLIRNAKNGSFWRVFENLNLQSSSVNRKCQNSKKSNATL